MPLVLSGCLHFFWLFPSLPNQVLELENWKPGPPIVWLTFMIYVFSGQWLLISVCKKEGLQALGLHPQVFGPGVRLLVLRPSSRFCNLRHITEHC